MKHVFKYTCMQLAKVGRGETEYKEIHDALLHYLQELENQGIRYEKIFTEGHNVPNDDVVYR